MLLKVAVAGPARGHAAPSLGVHVKDAEHRSHGEWIVILQAEFAKTVWTSRLTAVAAQLAVCSIRKKQKPKDDVDDRSQRLDVLCC